MICLACKRSPRRPTERLERQQAKALKKINELRRRCAAQVPYEEVCCSAP